MMNILKLWDLKFSWPQSSILTSEVKGHLNIKLRTWSAKLTEKEWCRYLNKTFSVNFFDQVRNFLLKCHLISEAKMKTLYPLNLGMFIIFFLRSNLTSKSKSKTLNTHISRTYLHIYIKLFVSAPEIKCATYCRMIFNLWDQTSYQ